eukprot:1361436-Amorphochlora_amoeboformis.AAC.1
MLSSVRRALSVVAATAAGGFAVDSFFISRAEKSVDYAQVRKTIAEAMDDLDYDDGSYGPILVRLAWHSSGTC